MVVVAVAAIVGVVYDEVHHAIHGDHHDSAVRRVTRRQPHIHDDDDDDGSGD